MAGDTGFRRTAPRRNDDQGIVALVADDLARGLTVDGIARRRGLPREFVRMAVGQAVADGRVRLIELTPRFSCGESVCAPDPESLVCAGCPLFPRESRAPRSLRARLADVLRAVRRRAAGRRS